MAATARPLSRSKGRRFIGSSPLRFQGVDDAVSGNRGDQAGSRAPLFCSSGRMRPVSTSMIQSCRYPERSDTKAIRSEEHTSELQSLAYLVCRLLLEKKKNTTYPSSYPERHRPPTH